jgi:hypothetical protein
MEESTEYLKRSGDLLCDIALLPSRIEVRVFPGSLDEEQVKRIVAHVQQIAGKERYPIFVIPDKNTKISFFALRVLASEEAMNYAKATAYIIRSFHHQIMAEALFSMYSPSRPIRVFKQEPEALKWLQTFNS